jgi:MFS family permease
MTGSGEEGGGASARLILLTLLAAWLGWGFDVFDGLLFSYVGPPTLHALVPGASSVEVTAWLGRLNAVFLVGWGAGGILFGRFTDRFGRTRTLLATMLLYAFATAACAACRSLPPFIACRVLASLGIGGEWAAGAALVAEVVSEGARPIAGALLYTASPAGMFVASKVTRFVVEGTFAKDPDGWRWAFLLGLVPAVFAFAIRALVEEPGRWKEHRAEPARLAELFAPALRRRTVTGLLVAAVALVGWWGILSFIPKLARQWCVEAQVADVAARVDGANDGFILGGIVGTLLTVPLAMYAGRKITFALYFVGALAASWVAFGMSLPLDSRLRALFLVGLTVFGVFGLFPFWLPELFPTRLRGTGSGFCYNTGRFVTAGLVYGVAELQGRVGLTRSVLAVSGVYVVGLLVLPFAVETKGQAFE